MSRSRKKHPWIKATIYGLKKAANRVVRRAKDVPNGGKYKRYYPQYDICDYKIVYDPWWEPYDGDKAAEKRRFYNK